MGWINNAQFERDHRGARNICPIDGHEGSPGNPLELDADGNRVHRSHFTDERIAAHLRRQRSDTDGRVAQPEDEDSRYVLYVPRGLDRFMDNLRPHAASHPLTVYGRADLDRRLAEAERLGVQVTYQRLDDDHDTDEEIDEA